MFDYKIGKYNLRLLNKDNKNELYELQKMRYEYLLKDFNDKLEGEAIDDDGYDQYTDSIIVVDLEKNKIAGTYRLATNKTTNGHPFLTEEEFDLSPLKGQGNILELGRAVIADEYRDGVVLNLIWAGILEYCLNNDIRFLLGTCSLHGTDPKVHNKTLAYLKNHKVLEEYPLYATHNSFEYPPLGSEEDSERDLPPLLRFYLKFGAKVSMNGYIDYSFNSCDVITIVDLPVANQKYINHYLRKLEELKG